MANPALTIVDGAFSIHRLEPGIRLPDALSKSPLHWIARTPEEITIVCDSSIELPSTRCSRGWARVQVQGPLDFSETGILSRIASALADVDVSIFALSTFDTDYVLLPSGDLGRARGALTAAGYTVGEAHRA